MWQISRCPRAMRCSTANATPNLIVGDNRGSAPFGVASIDHDGGYVPVDQAVDGRVLQHCGPQNQAVDLPRQHVLDDGGVTLGIVSVARDRDLVSFADHDLLDAGDQGRERRIEEIRNEHADGVRAARAKARSEGVHLIVQTAGHTTNTLDDIGRDEMLGIGIQRARRGGDMHLGGLCYVFQCRLSWSHDTVYSLFASVPTIKAAMSGTLAVRALTPGRCQLCPRSCATARS